MPLNSCVVPQGVNGPVAVWVTSDNQALINNPRDRATDKLVAGPTMVFVDSSPDVLAQLARTQSSSVPNAVVTSGSTAVSTITPSQASAVVASAFATPAVSVMGFSSVSM